VEVDAEPGLQARADPDRLEQILMALVDNAARYGPHGEPVSVVARGAGATVEIAVSDRGAGPDPALADALFDELRQGQDAREGAGIGLFLASTLARAQDGGVRVQGSTFTVTLPGAGE
jgi:signal transduction histidine kinase